MPVVALGVLSVQRLRENLVEQAKVHQQSIRDLKAKELSSFLEHIEVQLVDRATSDQIRRAAREFIGAFRLPERDRNLASTSLRDYYTHQFRREYEAKYVGDKTAKVEQLYDALSPISRYFQTHWIADNPHPLGSKDAADQVTGMTFYNVVHGQNHPELRRFLKTFGYYDIFIIDNLSGYVVYSVFKELDFATSMTGGPFAETNLGRLVQQLIARPQNFALFSDMQRYSPSYEAPAAFVGTSIYDANGNAFATLVFQIPIEKIDKIITSNHGWESAGLGRTGQLFLLGEDMFFRSFNRNLVSNPNFKNVLSKQLSSNLMQQIELAKTTALIEKAEDRRELTQQREAIIYNTDLSGAVIGAALPVKFPGVDWLLVSEVSLDEILDPLWGAIVVVILVSFLAVLFVVMSAVLIVRATVPNLEAIMMRLQVDSEELSQLGQRLNESAQEVSQSSDLQATSVAENAAAIQQINKALVEADSKVEQADANVVRISQIAETNRAGMLQLNERFKQLNESQRALESVSGLIDKIRSKTVYIEDIVLKTQLLSFNAAIESARAGSYGRGFAVVADEIGKLATQSGEASRQINDLIQSSASSFSHFMVQTRDRIQSSGAAVENAKNQFDDVYQLVSAVAKDIEELTAVFGQQRVAIGAIDQAIQVIGEKAHTNVGDAQQALDDAKSAITSGENLMVAVDELAKVVHGGQHSHLRKAA